MCNCMASTNWFSATLITLGSHMKGLITKEHIATRTHLNFKFKPALYSNTLVITLFNSSTKLFLAEIITVTQETSLPINASSPVRHAHF